MISAHEGGHTVSCFSAISGRQTAKLGGLTLKVPATLVNIKLLDLVERIIIRTENIQ